MKLSPLIDRITARALCLAERTRAKPWKRHAHLIPPATMPVRRLPQGARGYAAPRPRSSFKSDLIIWARKQCSDPSATDVLVQHLQDALQVRDSRRIVPAGYRLQRIGEMLDELNILGTLDDRRVHPIE